MLLHFYDRWQIQYNTLIMCSSKNRLELRITPRWFWHLVWLTVFSLIKIQRGRWRFIFLVFLLKFTSLACLLGSGLKLIFPLICPTINFYQIIIQLILVVLLSSITENNGSSANNLACDETFEQVIDIDKTQ